MLPEMRLVIVETVAAVHVASAERVSAASAVIILYAADQVSAVLIRDTDVECDAYVAAIAKRTADANAGLAVLIEESYNVAVVSDQMLDKTFVFAADSTNELPSSPAVLKLAK